MGYDAFISYSHAGDGQLAPAVQSGLQRMARPWYRRRALHVFRDETGLSVNPDLWQAIRAALDDSEWFVLFASPEAAQSEWVNLEVETWLDAKPVERVLPVITGGTVEWDAARNDFTPDSDAVPPALRGMYADQPRWLDLRWARTADDLDLRNAGFRLAIAGLAAPMHGMPKDEFEGEDVRLHRRAMRFARLGIATLVVFAVAAIAASVLAFGYAQRANASADRERRSAAAARAARADADALAANERDAQDAATAAAENANAQQDRAETEAQKAKQAQDEAEAAQADAEAEADNARQAQATADASAQDAKQQAARADRQATVAQTQGSRADAEAQRANDAATAAQQNADEARVNAAEASANAQTAAENAAEAKRIADDLATANTSLAATNDQLVDERNLSGRQRVAAVANRLFAEAGTAAANHDDAISSLLAVQGQAFAARTTAAGGGGKSALGRAGDTPGEGLVGDDAITTGLATALTDNPALLQVPSAPGLQGAAGGMGYSADGSLFAAATANNTLTVWALPSWSPIWTSGDLEWPVRDVAFTGDDVVAVTALSLFRFDRTASGYEQSATVLNGCCVSGLRVAGDTITALESNPHGESVVDSYDAQLKPRWHVFGQYPMASAVSDDGTRVAIEDQTGAIPEDGIVPGDGVAIYDATTGDLLQLLRLPTDSVDTQIGAVRLDGDDVVAFEVDATGMRMLRWTKDGAVTAGNHLYTEAGIRALSPDGRYLVVTTAGDDTWLYDVERARAVPLALPRGERLDRLAFGPGELMVRPEDGTTLRFGLDVDALGLPVDVLAQVDVPSFIPPQIAVGSRYTALYGDNVRLFDNTDGHELSALPVAARTVTFDRTGAIAVVANDGGVQMLDAAGGRLLASVDAYFCADAELAGTVASGTVLALCGDQDSSWPPSAVAWDLRDGAFVNEQTIAVPDNPNIVMDDDGDHFAVDRTMYERIGDTWQATVELPSTVTTISPNGTRAAIIESTIDMYDTTSGQLMWHAATAASGDAVWSSNGSTLYVSANEFGGTIDDVATDRERVEVWDVASGALSWSAATDRRVTPLPGHTLLDTAIRTDGEHTHFEMRRLHVDADALADRACDVADRDLTPTEWTRFVGDTDPYEPTCSSR